MRTCPRCTYPLTVVTHPENHAELDHCSRCGGSFLLPGDLTEAFGPLADPELWTSDDRTIDLGPSKLRSPIDSNPMHAYVVSSKTAAVELDICQTSGGIWLDALEGEKLIQIMRDNEQNEEAPSEEEPGVLSYLFQILTGFPVEAYNPVRQPAVTVYSLIGLIALCFGVQLYMIHAGTSTSTFFSLVGSVPSQVIDGSQLWGLVTYAFFHGGWMHIFGNLYFLYVFGDNVEDTLGIPKFLLIFFLSSIAGALLHTAFFPGSTVPLVGASGAISGLMGAYLVLFPEVKVWMVVLRFVRFKLSMLYYLLFWLGLQVFMAFHGGKGVAWMAHIGGFAVGILFGFLFRNSSRVIQLREQEALSE